MVMNVNVEQLTDTSVNVSWDPIRAYETICYTVYYRPSDAMEMSKEVTSISQTSAVIYDLISGVEYQFQVRAKVEFEGIVYNGSRSPPYKITLSTSPCK